MYDTADSGVWWSGPKPTRNVWYGWQNLIGYGSSFMLLATSPFALEAAGVTVPLGLTGLAFSGAIVHWAHGHVGKGFGALALTVGSTFGLGALGVGIECGVNGCNGLFSGLFGAVVGGGLGLFTGIAIDVGALSFEKRVPDDEDEATRRWAPRISLVPSLDLRPGRATFGVAGTF